MQFQVPQFIEVEDKIFGPLTLKQFVYIAGGAGASVALWFYLPSIIAIVLIIPLVVFSLMLAFYKKNGKPFIDTVESAFYYFFGGKLYIWKKEERAPTKKAMDERNSGFLKVPKISESKLKDLTWSLDIKESLNPVTRGEDK